MNDIYSLSGKTILITGASSGIGRQTAITLSEAGAQLVITGRDEKRLNDTFISLKGDGHLQLMCDLTNIKDREDMVSKLPKLNGIVHAAGVIDIKPVKFIDKGDIHAINTINYQAPVLLIQALLFSKLLSEKASIVFITSISAHLGAKGFGLYAASKGALTSFARVLALETASLKIRVNCLAAGMVKSPMFDVTTEAISEEALEDNEKLYPLGFATQIDIAYGVQYLLCDASERITGITLTIDGGYSIS